MNIRPKLRRLFARLMACASFKAGENAAWRPAERNVIAASPLFDKNWYLDRNPDVAATGMDPAMHYLLHGAAEGRDPGPRFSTSAYLAIHPDVEHHRMNPLLHYILHGANEGRQIAPSNGAQMIPSIAKRKYEEKLFCFLT